ncbi:MAG: hypothetical protein Q8P05_05940 [Candidatus Diapherotrites archaeon]|nr:hypothetical protein [Candidatus Diapherotrites archaeon]MDZ4256687.1 hypothetical protein [archaeon]
MLPEDRRKRVVRVMIVLYLVFGLALLYFFSFNTGLSLHPDPTNQDGIVTIRNESVHLIRDIQIVYVKAGEKIPLHHIPSLQPEDQIPVLLLPEYADQGFIVLEASAPYHLSQQLVIAARANQVPPNVLLTFSYPDFGFVDVPVEPVVRACNQENFPIPLRVELRLSDSSIAPNPSPQSWTIQPGTCASVTLPFTPSSEAKDLSLNIRVLNQTLVIVEQAHVLDIFLVENGANGDAPSG